MTPTNGGATEGPEATLATIRELIPMDYLEAAGGDLITAVRAYSEARWRIIERCKAAEAAAPCMRDALEAVQELIDVALPQFNWGKSALSADAIRLLNEVPEKVRAALSKTQGGGQ